MGSPSTLTQRDEARDGAVADDDVVEGGIADFFAVQMPLASMRARDSNLNSPRHTVFKASRQLVGRNGGEKAEAADVDAEHGRFGAGNVARDLKHGAVAAKNEEQIHFRARCCGVGEDAHFSLATRAVTSSDDEFAAGALDERGGRADDRGEADFSRLPMRPIVGFVSVVFQSAREILCCRPGRARETHHTAPAKASLRATKSCEVAKTRSCTAASVMTPRPCRPPLCRPQIAA